jgi:hypothetical protein
MDHLEARIAELEHKAEQYDTVVRAVDATDGGQYRHDVISAIEAWKRRAEAAEEDKAILRRANDESNNLRIHTVEYLRAKLARAVEALEMITTHDASDGQCDNGYTPVGEAKIALVALQDAPQDVASPTEVSPDCDKLREAVRRWWNEARYQRSWRDGIINSLRDECLLSDKLREERDRLLLRADDVLCEIVDITDPNLTSPSERDWLIAQARGVHIDITNALHPDTPGQGETCRYTYDSEWTAWHSECGHTEGLLSDQWQYCPYCRKPIEIRGGEA